MADEKTTEEKTAEEAASEQGAKEVRFALQRIYLKDMSFESPMGVAAFQIKTHPKIDQDLNTSVNKVNSDHYEVVLKLTINATVEGKTAFLVEIQQAGLFHITGVEGGQLAHVLNTTCAQTLFPYAREAVDNAVIKGGFPALNLPPINFDALFAQAVKGARAKTDAKKSDAPASAD